MIDQRLITPFQATPMLGMGNLGQLFTSTNVTQWGIGEWAAIIIGGYLSYKVITDTKIIGGKALKKTKRARRRIGKAAVSGTSKIGTVVTVGALAAAGYIGYELYTNSQSGGA